jgi:biopolymer transport protein ExbD
MASVGGGAPSGGSRRKTLDAEVNLIPFIDLLSMCICFLLMTAVWVELGAVQVKQSHGTEAKASARDSVEMELKFVSSTAIEVQIKRGGRIIQKAQVKGKDSQMLFVELDRSIPQWTGKGSEVSSAMITPSAHASYGDLVSAMDVLRRHQIMNLGVVPVRGEG